MSTAKENAPAEGTAIITIHSNGQKVEARVDFDPPIPPGEPMPTAHRIAAEALYAIAARYEGPQDHVIALRH